MPSHLALQQVQQKSSNYAGIRSAKIALAKLKDPKTSMGAFVEWPWLAFLEKAVPDEIGPNSFLQIVLDGEITLQIQPKLDRDADTEGSGTRKHVTVNGPFDPAASLPDIRYGPGIVRRQPDIDHVAVLVRVFGQDGEGSSDMNKTTLHSGMQGGVPSAQCLAKAVKPRWFVLVPGHSSSSAHGAAAPPTAVAAAVSAATRGMAAAFGVGRAPNTCSQP